MIKTIESISSCIYEEKKSKFIAFAIPVHSEENAKTILRDYKTKYNDSKHILWAYKIGEIERKNNDGEPTGATAVYNAIVNSGLNDILLLVVRYFGGILLGVGGLSRAYGKVANDCLNNAKICEMKNYLLVNLKCTYKQSEAILNTFKTIRCEYKDYVNIEIAICEENISKVKNLCLEYEIVGKKLM